MMLILQLQRLDPIAEPYSNLRFCSCAVEKPLRLVGSPMMLNQLFESWREWVEVTRRSKDSKKPLGRDSFKGARVI